MYHCSNKHMGLLKKMNSSELDMLYRLVCMLVSELEVFTHFSNEGSKAKFQSALLGLHPAKLQKQPDALQVLNGHVAATSARHDLAVGLHNHVYINHSIF